MGGLWPGGVELGFREFGLRNAGRLEQGEPRSRDPWGLVDNWGLCSAGPWKAWGSQDAGKFGDGGDESMDGRSRLEKRRI